MRRCFCVPGESESDQARLRPPLPGGVVRCGRWHGMGGTIRGTVRFTGAAVEQKKLPVTVDHSVCGKEKDAEDIVLSPEKGIRNVVVSLQTPPPGATWPVSLPSVQLDQQQCVYVPRVVVVPVGGTVEFLNTDRLLHNLHSNSTGNPTFNRTQPRGRTIPIVFTKPEIVRVDCDLHPWMRAWVVVAEHPFYAVTNDQGSSCSTMYPRASIPSSSGRKAWEP